VLPIRHRGTKNGASYSSRSETATIVWSALPIAVPFAVGSRVRCVFLQRGVSKEPRGCRGADRRLWPGVRKHEYKRTAETSSSEGEPSRAEMDLDLIEGDLDPFDQSSKYGMPACCRQLGPALSDPLGSRGRPPLRCRIGEPCRSRLGRGRPNRGATGARGWSPRARFRRLGYAARLTSRSDPW
jgi:hypothetical protein